MASTRPPLLREWKANPSTTVLEVHTGILNTPHNGRKTTPMMTCVRVDRFGDAFKKDVGIRDISEVKKRVFPKPG